MEEDSLYIIMEYAVKGDLHKLLRTQREKKEFLSEDALWLIAF
jgi:hypothetical protein